jgi:hypothetical protein
MIGMRMTVKTEQPNMSTTIEQCGIVQFLWVKDMATKDIHKEMLPVYGEHCLLCQATL